LRFNWWNFADYPVDELLQVSPNVQPESPSIWHLTSSNAKLMGFLVEHWG
jgi:hypothetical protein